MSTNTTRKLPPKFLLVISTQTPQIFTNTNTNQNVNKYNHDIYKYKERFQTNTNNILKKYKNFTDMAPAKGDLDGATLQRQRITGSAYL